jgi:hypothetical protein
MKIVLTKTGITVLGVESCVSERRCSKTSLEISENKFLKNKDQERYSPAVMTTANIPSSAAMNTAWTVCAGKISFPNLRLRVVQASAIRVHLNPSYFAALTVVSIHMWLIAPHITRSVISDSLRTESSSVWRKLLGKCFSMIISSARGLTLE